jgi:HEAT repeat protein
MAVTLPLERKPSRLSSWKWCIVAAVWLGGLGGCADGPLYQMKHLSPWHQAEWKRDRELGPTFGQRMAELDLLAARLPGMSPDEQQQWALLLERIATKDTSPEMRSRAVTVMSKLDGEIATRALNVASTDEVEKVRLAACRAWAEQQTPQARDMLMSLARTDESVYVRQAAIRSMGQFKDAEVRTALASALDDKNPAVQQQAVVALRSVTGRDFGGDLDAWRQFVETGDASEPEPLSMTAWLTKSLPWAR